MELIGHAPNVLAAVLTLGIIACLVFPLRVYIRVTKKAWGYDDWCMCIGFIPFIALTIACIGSPFNGVGVPQGKMDDVQQTAGRLWFFCFEVCFCIAVVPIKLSISFMLARIADPKRKYVYALWGMSGLMATMNLISLFYIVFECKPVAYAWDYSIEGGWCNPSYRLADIYYADTAVNILMDWFCALLPIPLLWNIQMNTNTKISVGFLLSLGVFASLAACIRLKYTVNLNNSQDFLLGAGDIVTWGYAENATGVIVGCISTLRPLFSRLFQLGTSNGASAHELKDTTPRVPLGSAYSEQKDAWPGSKGGRASVTVKSGQYKKDAGLSFSESEEELVHDTQNGIHVQKSVMQRRDFAS